MKSHIWIAGVALAAVAFVSPEAQADEALPPELLMGAGVLDPLHRAEHSQWMAALEYRFKELRWNLRPWLGVAHAERGTTLASAGLVYTLAVTSGLRFSAGWAPSYYDAGAGRDLGSRFDFYSFAEAEYAFENQHVVSLRFGHLSNCGFAGSNPGTETLMLSYSLPLPR